MKKQRPETEQEQPEAPKKAEMVALKDWHIFLPPEYDLHIEAGQDLSEIPEKFHPNLVTEGVMKGK